MGAVGAHARCGMSGPFRHAATLGDDVRQAYDLADAAGFCRRVGLDERAIEADIWVGWQGGGSDDWE